MTRHTETHVVGGKRITVQYTAQRGIRKFNPKYPQPLVKRERPPMPGLAVRIQVVRSQLLQADLLTLMSVPDKPLKLVLQLYLLRLAQYLGCSVSDLRLDHNPALILRLYNPKIKEVAARYKPHAHDPNFMLYRSAHGHHIKTNVSGDGAQRSDTGERMHRRRMDENRGLRPRKPKKKIAIRPFAKVNRPLHMQKGFWKGHWR